MHGCAQTMATMTGKEFGGVFDALPELSQHFLFAEIRFAYVFRCSTGGAAPVVQ
jgi:hypothetical protein